MIASFKSSFFLDSDSFILPDLPISQPPWYELSRYQMKINNEKGYIHFYLSNMDDSPLSKKLRFWMNLQYELEKPWRHLFLYINTNLLYLRNYDFEWISSVNWTSLSVIWSRSIFTRHHLEISGSIDFFWCYQMLPNRSIKFLRLYLSDPPQILKPFRRFCRYDALTSWA